MIDLPICNVCNRTRYTVVNAEKSYWRCYGCVILERITIVPDTGCWLWTGARRGLYGVMAITERQERSVSNVHRLAFALWKQSIPEGYSVLHRCHTKLCCNPDHLYLKLQPQRIAVQNTLSPKREDALVFNRI